MSEHDLAFDCMGSSCRLLVGPPADRGGRPAEEAAAAAHAFLQAFAARLSRFRADGELSRLNADARRVVPVSSLLAASVSAGVWAAELTGGLVDPTLVDPLHAIGYGRSRAGVPRASLAGALAAAPPRRPARPDPGAPWRGFEVNLKAGTVDRPPELRFDSGGTGKGLAADTVGRRLAAHERFVVDVGGDLRVGGRGAIERPFEVEVENPFGGDPVHVLRIGAGGVATSGLRSRIWQADGRYVHHLLDPATGEPAWTGLVSVTALAPSALEAETRSKAALLSGPAGARAWLEPHGGIAVHDDGYAELVGPLARPRVRLRAPAGVGA